MNDCERALSSPMISRDFEDLKVIDWLNELLKTLWVEGEGFSGKRPFGGSGWQADLIRSLIDCGYIPGSLDRDHDGRIEDEKYNPDEANLLILELISYAFHRQ